MLTEHQKFHPDNLHRSLYLVDFQTFYISEQVSHHPPISAFYVTNRREGFTVGSSILAKSKFYGNSTSAILEGTGKVRQITSYSRKQPKIYWIQPVPAIASTKGRYSVPS